MQKSHYLVAKIIRRFKKVDQINKPEFRVGRQAFQKMPECDDSNPMHICPMLPMGQNTMRRKRREKELCTVTNVCRRLVRGRDTEGVQRLEAISHRYPVKGPQSARAWPCHLARFVWLYKGPNNLRFWIESPSTLPWQAKRMANANGDV